MILFIKCVNIVFESSQVLYLYAAESPSLMFCYDFFLILSMQVCWITILMIKLRRRITITAIKIIDI